MELCVTPGVDVTMARVRRHCLMLFFPLGVGCSKPAPPPPPPAIVHTQPAAPPHPPSPFASDSEPALVTCAKQRLPIGRWTYFNLGNYNWVARLKPGEKFRVSGRWEDNPTGVALKLTTVDIESDGEWDEGNQKAELSVDAGADAVVSGVIALTPGANAARIRLSRNNDGTGRLGLRVDPIP
jgi:hypothetical protein